MKKALTIAAFAILALALAGFIAAHFLPDPPHDDRSPYWMSCVERGLGDKVCTRRWQDTDTGAICYVTNKGAISCVMPKGK